MVAENKHRHCRDIGTTGTTGTDRGQIAAPVTSRHERHVETVPQVPVVPVPRGVPVMFHRFAGSLPTSNEPPNAPERLSPPEEERIESKPDDDGPWIINAEAAAELDDLEEVDFDEVPVCSCGRYCDSQTLDDAWHCSHCDPDAEERRKRTQRWLRQTNRIRQQNI